MEVLPQRLINVDVTRKPDIATVPEITDAIRQVESELRGQGRVLIRYSGTQCMCRVMVEGPTKELTDRYCEQLASIVRRALG
jgi:phosphoglucosamine mutase